jgi:hypothetical protein
MFKLGIFLSLTSCTLSCLSIQSQYLNREDLASYQVETPDPRLDDPMVGQRLLIQWSLKSEDMQRGNVILYLKVRLRNYQEQEFIISICQRQGTYIYDLMDQEYFDSKGILTYKAEIWAGEDRLASWTHPLWVELIEIK